MRAPEDALPLRPTSDGVRLAVRLTPRARADRIRNAADGRAAALCVAVTAPPADNQANEALLRVLSRDWRIARRDLAIAGGHKSRDKLASIASIASIAGDPAALIAQLTAALTTAGTVG